MVKMEILREGINDEHATSFAKVSHPLHRLNLLQLDNRFVENANEVDVFDRLKDACERRYRVLHLIPLEK